jgi:hypothetical protein
MKFYLLLILLTLVRYDLAFLYHSDIIYHDFEVHKGPYSIHFESKYLSFNTDDEIIANIFKTKSKIFEQITDPHLLEMLQKRVSMELKVQILQKNKILNDILSKQRDEQEKLQQNLQLFENLPKQQELQIKLEALEFELGQLEYRLQNVHRQELYRVSYEEIVAFDFVDISKTIMVEAKNKSKEIKPNGGNKAALRKTTTLNVLQMGEKTVGNTTDVEIPKMIKTKEKAIRITRDVYIRFTNRLFIKIFNINMCEKNKSEVIENLLTNANYSELTIRI